MLYGAEAGEPSPASTKLLDNKSMQGVVDQSELFEDAPVISEAERGAEDEIKFENIELEHSTSQEVTKAT